MPHLLVTAKAHDRNRTLGWLAVAWIEHYLVYGRGDVIGQPVKLTDEMAQFIVDCYALDEDGRRLYDSVFLSRPKGCDKSGVASYIAMFEAFGPCRGTGEFAVGGEVYENATLGNDGTPFRYEYEEGDPIGRHVTSPFLRCLATEEGQVGNVYDSIYFNLTEGPLAAEMTRATDAGLTRVFLPRTGEIRPSTSSSASKDGGLETWVDFDETHLYTTPELRRTYAVVKRNLRKRKKIAETWYLETTTMYAPGEDSVAESTYKIGELIQEGKLKRDRLLLDHRWGEIDPDDLGDEEKLRKALTDAYGEALLWNDLDGLVNEVYDPESDISDSIRYFLNDRYSPGSSWLNESDIRGVTDEEKRVLPGEAITLGLDGSRGRARGKPDATALIGCRVSDGHLFELGVWEAPDIQSQWKDWEPSIVEVEAALLRAFNTYDVVGFYADPAKDWRSHVNAWEAKWGPRCRLKAGANHPFEWWMTGGRASLVERAVEQLEGAIRKRDITISGEFRLVQHLRNARRRITNGKLALGKENDYSPHKIDAAVAAVLAYQARLDALAKGFGTQKAATLIRAR
jgi:hypothetical protein